MSTVEPIRFNRKGSTEVVFEYDKDKTLNPSYRLKRAVEALADERFDGLRNIELTHQVLRDIDLSGHTINGTDFSGSSMNGANLSRSTIHDCDFTDTSLVGVNFYGATIRRCKFKAAHLVGANFANAVLEELDFTDAYLPAPAAVLQARWGVAGPLGSYTPDPVLVAALMSYDADNHHSREAFKKWANIGPCPYANVRYDRAAHFQENRTLWKGKGIKARMSAFDMLMKLFELKKIKWNPIRNMEY